MECKAVHEETVLLKKWRELHNVGSPSEEKIWKQYLVKGDESLFLIKAFRIILSRK